MSCVAATTAAAATATTKTAKTPATEASAAAAAAESEEETSRVVIGLVNYWFCSTICPLATRLLDSWQKYNHSLEITSGAVFT